MHLVVNKAAFKNALAIAKRALPAVVVQEERSHILVRTRGDKILVSATNNDFKALCTIPLEESVETEFAFTVEPKTVSKLLTKTKVENLKIEVDSDECIARYYTTANGDSFAEAQSFTEDVMLTFDETLGNTEMEVTLKKDAVNNGLNYAKEYLEVPKVEKARYDFIIINKGLIYSANGSNKMGFMVNRDFKDFQDFKIRKLFVPLLLGVMDSLKGEEFEDIILFETEKDAGIRTVDGSVILSCLKSDASVPEVKRDLAHTKGPYCVIDRKAFIENIDRLGALEKTGKSFGMQINLKGEGENASIEMNLLSSLKSKEIIPCKRVDSSDEDVEQIIDNKLIRGILTSFNNDEVRLYINDVNSKMFKIYEKGEINESEYHSFAIGAYSRVLRK